MPLFRKQKISRCDDTSAMVEVPCELVHASGQLMCPLCNVHPAFVPLRGPGSRGQEPQLVCNYCFTDEYARQRMSQVPAFWREAEPLYQAAFDVLRADGEMVLQRQYPRGYTDHENCMRRAVEAAKQLCREHELRH